MNEEKEIGPEKFFNIEHPGNPYVEIQFRTSKPTNADNPDSAVWESITLENNFFDQVVITDESGFQNLELTLQDRDYINIEDIVLRTIMNSRVEAWAGMANKENKEKYDAATSSLDSSPKDPEQKNNTILKNTFQVYIDNSMASCIRVRFGWASNQKEKYYETSSTDSFVLRTEQTNPVIRSPWLYFMMLGANYNIDANGRMTFLIKGVSVAQAYLEKAKFLINGTVLEGLPKDIWDILAKSISEANNGDIQLANKIGELSKDQAKTYNEAKAEDGKNRRYKEPDPDFFHYQNKIIKLSSLYENPMIYLDNSGNEKRSLHFKSIRQLLNDFVNLLNSKYIDYDGSPIEIKDDEVPNMEQVHHIEKPDYYITVEKSGNSLKPVNMVHLYYRKPNPKQQTFIRVYSWKDAKNSIIKNFSVSTDSDFAQMNAPITIKDEFNNLKQINLGSISSGAGGMDLAINTVENLSKEINEAKGKIGFLTGEVFKSGNYNNAQDFVSSFIQNLNDNVFKGTIELLLDPFYLFDNALRPYEYLIKIDVNTPSRYTRKGEYIAGSKSYLTGYYMIGKITHSITNNSATTSLEVIKFPEVREGETTSARAQMKADIVSRKSKLEALKYELETLNTQTVRNKTQLDINNDELNRYKSSDQSNDAIKQEIDGLNAWNKNLEASINVATDKMKDIQSKIDAMKIDYGVE